MFLEIMGTFLYNTYEQLLLYLVKYQPLPHAYFGEEVGEAHGSLYDVTRLIKISSKWKQGKKHSGNFSVIACKANCI